MQISPVARTMSNLCSCRANKNTERFTNGQDRATFGDTLANRFHIPQRDISTRVLSSPSHRRSNVEVPLVLPMSKQESSNRSMPFLLRSNATTRPSMHQMPLGRRWSPHSKHRILQNDVRKPRHDYGVNRRICFQCQRNSRIP